MDEFEGSVRIECEALSSHAVRVVIAQSGRETVDVQIPPSQVAAVASALLSAVATAGRLAGVAIQARVGEQLSDPATVQPTGVGLMQGKEFNSSALVLQFGAARIAVRMADQEFRALGQALGTLAAPRGLAQ